MSRAYKFHNPEGLYFVSFATVGWIDVFTRSLYKDIVVESIRFCQKEKGLNLYAWVIMTNHVHLIAEAKGNLMQHILRDLKRHTSKQLLRAIAENPQESRKEWMLAIFSNAGKYNSSNKDFQFWQQDNRPIELSSAAMISQKLDYLHANPVKAGYVDKEEEYLYSSARDYHGIGKGMLEIILL